MHHQKIVISIPGGTEVTVSEENGVYFPSYVIGDSPAENGSATSSIKMDSDKTVDFTNTRKAVAPTGFSSKILPFAIVMVAGLLLIPAILLGKRRKEEEDN